MDICQKINEHKNEIDNELLLKKNTLLDLLNCYIIMDLSNLVWNYCDEYVKSDGYANTHLGTFKGYGYKIDGKESGKWLYWYYNGNKSLEIEIVNGKIDGNVTEWYCNGNKMSEGTISDNGRIGKWIFYYRNGNKDMEGFVNNDRQVGVWHYWHEDGIFKETRKKI